MHRAYLGFEFTLIFLGIPLLLRGLPQRFPPLPLLWVATGVCLSPLLRDPSFVRAQLWNPEPLGESLPGILFAFALGAALIAAGVRFLAPDLLFQFIRANAGLWALVMLLYPVLSVYPQGVIYRAFLMHRYQPLFDSPLALVLASGIAFSLMHVIFRNPLALGLTLAGGLLFAWRYQKTGSLFVSSFEHALYGCFLFTIGLGRYFYSRSIQAAGLPRAFTR